MRLKDDLLTLYGLHYRAVIRGWLTRSILKESGIWGSGLDTLLTALRDVIRESDTSEFPAAQLRRVMAQRGKTLDFIEEEIEDLADMRLGDRRIFPLLTMLFPDLDSRDGSDIDHVFPKSRFTPTRLKGAGVEEDLLDEYRDRADRLANLQLLDRSVNNEKRATLPAEWLRVHCPSPEFRKVTAIATSSAMCPRKSPSSRNSIPSAGNGCWAASPNW